MADREEAPFFVGYLSTPKPLRTFYLCVIPVLIAGLAGVLFGFVLAQASPGDGRYGPRVREPMTGYLQLAPYPILHVPAGAENPADRAVLLVNPGKNGAQNRTSELDGSWVDVTGVFLGRQGFSLLQLSGRRDGIRASEVEADVPESFTRPPEDLGTASLRGEIVDCKCYAGAMRPGTGKNHKACANLCLLGGIPPVLVTWYADGTSQHFVLTGEDGSPLSTEIFDTVGQAVEVSGEVERIADLLFLRIDPETVLPL